LGALDKKLREEMQIELRQLQRSVGITFVFVTHDQEEALTLSDRIAVMSKGKALQIDNATHLYEAPNCREVADFIGSMNFFDGAVKGIDNGHAIVDVGSAGNLRVPMGQQKVGPGAEVTVAVRPEKVHIDWQAPGSAANAIVGRVDAEAYFGDRSHFYIEVPGVARRVAVALQNAQRSLDNAEARGRQVWLTWPTESSVLLPRE
jgi:ABC-type Fe3+/spermidine/putrescine transport system ATPase subunit